MLDVSNPRTPKGSHFDPTFSSKSNNFLFRFFCAPFFLIAEFLPFYHLLLQFYFCNDIILEFGSLVTWQIGDFWLFKKTEIKLAKTEKKILNFYHMISCKLPFLYFELILGRK